jgi:hypothetical protein
MNTIVDCLTLYISSRHEKTKITNMHFTMQLVVFKIGRKHHLYIISYLMKVPMKVITFNE